MPQITTAYQLETELRKLFHVVGKTPVFETITPTHGDLDFEVDYTAFSIVADSHEETGKQVYTLYRIEKITGGYYDPPDYVDVKLGECIFHLNDIIRIVMSTLVDIKLADHDRFESQF